MTKRVPLRHCVACRAELPKNRLRRVVLTPDRQVVIDIAGKLNGRGAYLCGNPACHTKAQKSRALERHLKVPVDAAIYEALKAGPAHE